MIELDEKESQEVSLLLGILSGMLYTIDVDRLPFDGAMGAAVAVQITEARRLLPVYIEKLSRR